jgi:hypothetical protein
MASIRSAVVVVVVTSSSSSDSCKRKPVAKNGQKRNIITPVWLFFDSVFFPPRPTLLVVRDHPINVKAADNLTFAPPAIGIVSDHIGTLVKVELQLLA